MTVTIELLEALEVATGEFDSLSGEDLQEIARLARIGAAVKPLISATEEFCRTGNYDKCRPMMKKALKAIPPPQEQAMKRYIPLIEDSWPWLLGAGMTVAVIAAVRIGFVWGVA